MKSGLFLPALHPKVVFQKKNITLSYNICPCTYVVRTELRLKRNPVRTTYVCYKCMHYWQKHNIADSRIVGVKISQFHPVASDVSVQQHLLFIWNASCCMSLIWYVHHQYNKLDKASLFAKQTIWIILSFYFKQAYNYLFFFFYLFSIKKKSFPSI